MLHLLEILGFALLSWTVVSLCPAIARPLYQAFTTKPCSLALATVPREALKAKPEVMSFDPGTLALICSPGAVACSFASPTPRQPERWVVAYSNEYAGANAGCLLAYEFGHLH